MKKDYSYLIGKNRKEILEEMGEEYNFFPAEVWTYTLKKLLFKSRVLFLFFKDDKVLNVKIKNCYGKCNA
ncbi:hypothetical protein J3D55_001576 [Chryseobacterium ginsenosidimutans]|nr:hypothetical protein [Chryseobacterium ginsenosidimutans]